MLASRQSPSPPLFSCLKKAGSLPSNRVILSLALSRYYEPLRLPMRPSGISFPYTLRLMSLQLHRIGSPALHCLSSMACHPCYPGRSLGRLPLSTPWCCGLPHLTTGSASPIQVTRLLIGSLALRPTILPFGNSRPLITQTPLPRSTKMYGQFLGRDFNPQDNQLLLLTVRSILFTFAFYCEESCLCK